MQPTTTVYYENYLQKLSFRRTTITSRKVVNVFDYVGFHEQRYFVVVKYTQSYATGSEIGKRKFSHANQ